LASGGGLDETSGGMALHVGATIPQHGWPTGALWAHVSRYAGPCIQFGRPGSPLWAMYPDTWALVSGLDGPLPHWHTLGPGIQICRPMYPVWKARWPTLGPCIQICGPLYALAHKTKVQNAHGLSDPPEASRNIQYMCIIYTCITTTPPGFSQWPLVTTDKSESRRPANLANLKQLQARWLPAGLGGEMITQRQKT